MNLFFRLLLLRILSPFRSAIEPDAECITPFRITFTDLDVLRHMNNGVYFSLQDLARIDLMMRSGMYKVITKNGWYPVIASETLRFRKSLKLFQAFTIHSKLVCWDEKYFYLEHSFVRKNEVIAKGMIKALFLKKTGGSLKPEELMQAIGFEKQPPAIPKYVKLWLEAEDLLSHQS